MSLVWTHRDREMLGIHHFQIQDTQGKPTERRPLQ